MQITIQLRSEVADELQKGSAASPEADKVMSIVRGFGLTLQPMHWGSTHPQLKTFFMVEAPDPESAAKLLARLQQNPAVESAYIKPADAPP